MRKDEVQTTASDIQEALRNRIACLYDMIRSVESSRCLVEWIGKPENLEKTNWAGHGHLFGHIQYVAYSDFILNTVALFEKNSKSSSFRALFDFICVNKSAIKVTGFSRAVAEEKHSEDHLCDLICNLKKKLPVWPHSGFKPAPDSLDYALDWMKKKRDELIAHREFKDLVAPRASIDMIEDGCGLLPLAMELYDAVYRIAAPDLWQHFNTSQANGDGTLSSIRHIAKQLEEVVTGEFARKREFWSRPVDIIVQDLRENPFTP